MLLSILIPGNSWIRPAAAPDYIWHTNASKCTIWNSVLKPSHSPLWKQLLNMRSQILQHIEFRVGNGNKFSIFNDPLLNNDFLISLFGQRVVSSLGSRKDALLSTLIPGNSWIRPAAAPDYIWNTISAVTITPGEDTIVWKHGRCTFTSVWDKLRICHPKVPWTTLVWNKGIPRAAVTTVLAIHDKLPSMVNLQKRDVSWCINSDFSMGSLASLHGYVVWSIPP
ncbi:uncharacterized protein LOC132270554 [Cornus florida]|uniref:uncharacterized protein LOC132270554 n=1 Tax=Cornus florida TaxID=4283 RepID=UPI002898695A|nr:uncharacterized protein LOC132270554 [Cornus florida]